MHGDASEAPSRGPTLREPAQGGPIRVDPGRRGRALHEFTLDEALRTYAAGHVAALTRSEAAVPPPDSLRERVLAAVAESARGLDGSGPAPLDSTRRSTAVRRFVLPAAAAACACAVTVGALVWHSGRETAGTPPNRVLLASLGRPVDAELQGPDGLRRCLDSLHIPADMRTALGAGPVRIRGQDAVVVLLATRQPGRLLALVVRPSCA
ncbi:MAG: hypothetical protein QM655_17005, partial [Nocardioidaceae bacterium]